MPTIDELRAAKSMLSGQLLQLGLGGHVIAARATVSVASAVQRAGRNVHAVGIGRKISDGKPDGALCVRVYVVQKLPRSLLVARDVIPAKLDGIDTDIVEAPPPFILGRAPARRRPAIPAAGRGAVPACTDQRKMRQRPVMGGISAGHRDITAGTIGCFCRSTAAGDDPAQVMALSNNHVLANVNAALIGDPLYQPGPLDGGTLTDYFATLHRFVPIKKGGQEKNRVDAAVGSLLPAVAYDRAICSIGAINGTTSATEDLEVVKHGRTTGLTEGRVDDIAYNGLVGMDHDDPTVVALFEEQIRIVSTATSPIGLSGDSGSLVISKAEKKAVGLYFAGPPNGEYGIANQISDVLQELQVELL